MLCNISAQRLRINHTCLGPPAYCVTPGCVSLASYYEVTLQQEFFLL